MAHALADVLFGAAGVEAHGVLDELVEVELIGAAGEAHDVVDPFARRLGADVDEDEGADAVGVLVRVLDGVEATHAVPHEDDRVEAEPLADGLDIGDEGLAGVVAVGRPRAVAVATLVEVDEAVAIRGSLAEFVEHVAGDAEAVEGEDDGSVIRAPLLVGQLQVTTGGGSLAVGRSQGFGPPRKSRGARGAAAGSR